MKLYLGNSIIFLFALLLLSSFFLTACGESASKDPVKAFEKIVKDGTEHAHEKSQTAIQLKTGTWKRDDYELGKVTYDIKKSDSLVTPLKGILGLNYRQYIFDNEFTTEEEALNFSGQLVPSTSMTFDINCRLEYGYKDGSWIFMGGECVSKMYSEVITPTRTEISTDTVNNNFHYKYLAHWVK